MYYIAECGSRMFGIERDSSDIDVAYVNTEEALVKKLAPLATDFINTPRVQFFENIRFISLQPYGVQFLCPKRFVEENELTRFIELHRDEYARDCEKKFFNNLFLNASADICLTESGYKKIHAKAMAYSLLYLGILKKYCETRSISSSVWLDEASRSFIKDIRNDKIPYSEARRKYDELKKEVQELKSTCRNFNSNHCEAFLRDLSRLFDKEA